MNCLKRVFKAIGKLLFSLFIINQTPDEVNHLLLKRKEHGVFLNYLLRFQVTKHGCI